MPVSTAPVDVLLVSLGSTAGLRAADAEIVGSMERAGAKVAVVTAAPQPDVRTFMVTDLRWARAAREAARAGIEQHAPRTVVYSTLTAAMFWPSPGAIRFDAPATANRPGRHGIWQRRLERRRLRQAPLLIPMAEGTLAEVPPGPRADAVIVPIPVEPSGPPARGRDIAALTYGANPLKKGLDVVVAAWARARRDDEELQVAGLDAPPPGVPHVEGVTYLGRLAPREYRERLRRTRVYVTAPRREDYGIAQLEALADGCRLVTTAAPGPYVALPLARALDPRLVGDDLAGALRIALDDPAANYAARAAAAIAPFRHGPVDGLVAEELMPRLLPGWRAPAPPTG